MYVVTKYQRMEKTGTITAAPGDGRVPCRADRHVVLFRGAICLSASGGGERFPVRRLCARNRETIDETGRSILPISRRGEPGHARTKHGVAVQGDGSVSGYEVLRHVVGIRTVEHVFVCRARRSGMGRRRVRFDLRTWWPRIDGLTQGLFDKHAGATITSSA